MYVPRISLAITSLGFAVVMMSCAKASTTDVVRGTADLLTVYKAPGSRFDRIVREVVRDSGTWRSLWDSVSGFGGSPQAPPTVDFDAAMLIVAAGPRVGAGDSVIIADVHLDATGLRAEVMTFMHCSPADISPVPVHVVRVPRVSGPVHFKEDSTRGTTCPSGS
jgi:hypothetical protein